MDIEGRIIIDLPLQEGVSKAGNAWKKKEWVMETFGQYPKKVKFTLFGDRATNVHIEMGKSYLFSIDVESREYMGRWYTDVNCFAAREIQAPQPAGMEPAFGAAPAVANDPFGAPAAPASFSPAEGEPTDDLPF